MKIFKYTEKRYLKKFFADGTLRIGTLYDYRTDLNLGQMVSDSMEGIKKAHGKIGYADATDVQENNVLNSMFQGNITLNDCGFDNIRIESPNMYVFCASTKYGRVIHEEWFKHERYDACYEIASAQIFFNAITRALPIQAEFLGCWPIVYYDSDDGVDINSPLANVHPAALKRWKNFGGQEEIRGIWQPKEGTKIQPIVIKVPKVIRLCSVKSILNR